MISNSQRLSVAILLVPGPGQEDVASKGLREAVRVASSDPVLAECVTLRLADPRRGRGAPLAQVQHLVLLAAASHGRVVAGMLLIDPPTTSAGNPTGTDAGANHSWPSHGDFLDACEGAGMHIEVRRWQHPTEPPGEESLQTENPSAQQSRSTLAAVELGTALIELATDLLALTARSPELAVPAAQLVKSHRTRTNGLPTGSPVSPGTSQTRAGVLDNLLRRVRPEQTPSLLDAERMTGQQAELWYLVTADGVSGRAGQGRWVRGRSAGLLERWARIENPADKYFSILSAGKTASRKVALAPIAAASGRMAPRPREYGLDMGPVCQQIGRMIEGDIAALDRRGMSAIDRSIVIIASELPLADAYSVEQYQNLCVDTQVIWLLPAEIDVSSQEFGPPHGLLVADHPDVFEEILTLLTKPIVDPQLPHAHPNDT